MMSLRSTVCFVALATSALAQGAPAPENLFYKAYYLNRGEHRYEQALVLYQQFLEAAPEHRFCGRAARDAVAILTRNGKLEEAGALRAKFANVLGRDTGAGQAKDDAAAGAAWQVSAAAGDGLEPLTDEQKIDLKKRLAELEERLATATADGDDRAVERLEQQIRRVQRSLKSGMAPPTRGGRRGGRGQRRSFVDMSDEEISQRVDRIEQFKGGLLERLRENGRDADAETFEKGWNKVKELLKSGEKEEAQKQFSKIMSLMRRA